MDYTLDHVGVSVENLDAQVEWYSRALGLERKGRFQVEALGLSGEFLLSPEGWAIEMLQREGSGGGLRAPDPMTALLTRGYGHICLRVTDVDAMFDSLIAAGGVEKLSPRQSPEPGVRFAFVADPEGNLIELLDRKGPIGFNAGSAQ